MARRIPSEAARRAPAESCTGFAGEDGEQGLVHVARKSAPASLRESRFGPPGCNRIRHPAVCGALELPEPAISG